MKKNYEYVLQQNFTDCGIASIMTILLNLGLRPSREKIINKLHKKHDGYTAYDLVKISKLYGVEAYAIREDVTRINKLPVIAHIIKDKNMFHFIVILEVNHKKRQIKIMDPSEGIKEMTFEEFNTQTTNIFILFEKGKVKKIKNQRLKKHIKELVIENKKIILKTVILSIIYVLLSLIFNYYLKTILTYYNKNDLLLAVFLLFFNITLVKNLIFYLKNKLILKLSIKIDKDITKNITNHIFKLPYQYFIKKTSGELVTIIDDIENFKEIITKVFILSFVDLILITVIIIYTCFLNIYIGISLVFILILLYLITKKYQYIFNDFFIKYKLNKIDYTSTLITNLTAYETIKNLNISKKISSQLEKKYNMTLDHENNYNQKSYNYSFITTLCTDLFYISLIFLSKFISKQSNIPILDIVLFSSIFYFLLSFLSNITESIVLYKVYQTSTERVLDCIDVKEESFEETNLLNISNISYENVSYENNEKALFKNINISFKKGDLVYLNGNSGIGKSTMMKLLLRYYLPSEGKILIDNVNINDLDLSFIRENITYIGQNESLFPGTIHKNLNLVSDDDTKLKDVLNITLLDKLLENNNIDLNFILEENGNNLSGGERKKIILARGLLHFKNVLILDEVFNEISIEEERKILKNIISKYKDKIIIMISHRNSNKDLFTKKINLKGDGNLYEIK